MAKKQNKDTFSEINDDIANNKLKTLYLLHGEEEYLKILYKNRIKNLLSATDNSMNYQSFYGGETEEEKIIEACETLPFLSDKRLVLVEDSGFFKKGGVTKLEEYFKDIPETTCLLFIEKETDGRGKLYKSLKKYGLVLDCSRQDEDTLKKWIMSSLKKEKLLITRDALDRFLALCGNDMENIQTELEKLISYCNGLEGIQIFDVENICCKTIENHIFEMIDLICNKRSKDALNLYYDLLKLKEAPMKILALIIRQFNILLKVRSLSNGKFSKTEMAKEAGVMTYFIDKYITMSKHYTINELIDILKYCSDTDNAIKTGLMEDKLSIEVLIVRLAT
ncbi:DNA polymerase III, delta subunit [Acetitomaculum ruminis DSM 5522]|uniref:DNA polymerase III subunit delta n=1 Tax=Acetitomaculum ruminis DSM 5522 TaxID=1120918 RepID=A0A1I0ZK14_9FIRM|nr:DNA polymerase III subunit delta [Acetitomaculum ruminis]SFB24553.1 DNA polymerase III, delta subunit [Acetitomaculum ruminis DSM 5522]